MLVPYAPVRHKNKLNGLLGRPSFVCDPSYSQTKSVEDDTNAERLHLP